MGRKDLLDPRDLPERTAQTARTGPPEQTGRKDLPVLRVLQAQTGRRVQTGRTGRTGRMGHKAPLALRDRRVRMA